MRVDFVILLCRNVDKSCRFLLRRQNPYLNKGETYQFSSLTTHLAVNVCVQTQFRTDILKIPLDKH